MDVLTNLDAVELKKLLSWAIYYEEHVSFQISDEELVTKLRKELNLVSNLDEVEGFGDKYEVKE